MPQLIECNGFAVVALRLTLPFEGNWTAALEVATDEQLEGAVEIADDGVTYSGTVVRSDVVAESCFCEVVGGAGGLRQDVDAASYRSVTLRTVADALLGAAGESLDGGSTAATLAFSLPFWTRSADRAGRELSRLTTRAGARWRVLPGGSVWVGTETWPETRLAPPELDRDGQAGTVLLAPDTLELGPGVTLDGRHVGRVEHQFGRDEPLRTTFWIEP